MSARSIVWLNFQAAEGSEEKSPNGTKEEEPCTYETYPCSETVSLNSSELFFRSDLKGNFNRCEQLSFIHPLLVLIGNRAGKHTSCIVQGRK